MRLNQEEIKILKENTDSTSISKILEIIGTIGTIADNRANKAIDIIKDINRQIIEAADKGHEKADYADLRIKTLYIRNFRKFPNNPSLLYGLDFTERNIPQSLILVGSNGTGKSSLYDALEKEYIGNISEAGFRKIEDNSFCLHNSSSSYEIHIDYNASYETKYIREHHAYLRTFFCSEGDLVNRISSMPQEANASWIDFFSTFLNLEGLSIFISNLKIIKDFIKHYSDRNATEIEDYKAQLIELKHELDLLESTKNYWATTATHEIRSIDLILEAIKKTAFDDDNNIQEQFPIRKINRWFQSIKDKYSYDEIVGINNIIEEYKTKVSSTIKTKISKLKKTALKETEEQVSENDKEWWANLRDNATNLLESLRKKLVTRQEGSEINNFIANKELRIQQLTNKINIDGDAAHFKQKTDSDELFNTYIESIENAIRKEVLFLATNDLLKKAYDIIKERFLDANEVLEMENEDNDIHINIVLKEDGGSLKYSPKRYFNTFRIKLFALSLQTLMAMSLMKSRKVFAPIVFDDVFYASDFENKTKLKTFFKSIFDNYKAIVGDDNHKLQLIFFTHDEQIFSTCLEAMPKENIKFGRLFNYSVMEQRAKDGKVNLYVKIK